MFTDIFIKRPVFASCVSMILLLAGFMAILNLKTRQYPKSDLAVVKVTTAYVGADADLVRGFVTTPLERSIASADGIEYLDSTSAQGLSTINAHLRLNYDINDALTQIQSKVAKVRNDLPPEAESPSIDVETSDSRIASIYLSFASNTLEANQITDYLLRVVQPKLSSLPGVQKADILGARIFAMRIWLKANKLAAYGISPQDLRAALLRNNFLAAIGRTKGSMVVSNLALNSDLTSKEEFDELIVANKNGALIKLKDVADVELGAENYDEEVRFNGKVATFMGVWALPNANVIEVVREVRKALKDLKSNLPPGLELSVPYDSTEYIETAISEVLKTFTETILIVIVVIFFFIGSLRSVLVPVLAIPMSLIGAAALMYLFGFSLNLLTLLAIVLAVGLVVDDAIVMLENVERHVQEGLTPYQASIKGARELVGPVIAMTITLAAVYAPIGIQGGLTGVLFREFAFTLAGAVAVSGFVALTLSPMMCSKLVRPGENSTALKIKVEHFFANLQEKYKFALGKVFNWWIALLIFSCVLMLSLPLLYMFSQRELAPKEDRGILFGIVQASPNSSIEQTVKYTTLVQGVFESFKEYQNSFQLTGPTFGFSGMLTKPWSKRDRSVLDMEGEAWGKVSQIPGVRVIVTTPPPLPGGSDFPVEFVINSTNEPKELYQLAGQLVQAAFASGKFMFADADLKFDMPQSEIILDRDKVSALGLDLQSVANDIVTMTGGNYINRFSIQGRSYKVIAQSKRNERLNAEDLLKMFVKGPLSKPIQLSTFATIKETVEPRELKRFGQLNSVTIQGAIVPGVSINDALLVLEEKASEILPKGYQVDYAGESRQLRKEGNALLTTLFFAIILIYLVLAAQFESFRDPFIILAGSVPLSMAGALVFSFLGATSMNIYSQVGLVTLVGLVAKNGILIVEFANVLQEQGKQKVEAVIEAAATRLRPILMTSCATVVGHFPLILAKGAGAEARNSIGIILVSGMFIGTFFTLFVVPVLYGFISKQKQSHVE